MPGTKSDYRKVLAMPVGYSSAAVTAGQNLLEFAVPFPCRIGGIVGRAETAGTGVGNTVLDVLKNGTSIWSASANRPTLAAISTGEFASTVPEARAMQPLTPSMDRLTLQVAGISSTGHARLSLAVVLESPDAIPNSVRR
jgi:hypothetical protein